MKAVLKEMILDNFKGVKHAEYNFSDGVVLVEGKNGLGKSTIGTAFMWVFNDTDINNNSRPKVQPNGGDELTSMVALVLNVDGKDVSVSKCQKSRKDTADKVITVNNYTINGLEKSATSFKAYLTELGFDFDKIAYLVNPLAFVAEKAKDMRSILFSMVDNITDKDLAKSIDGVDETAKLLETYSLDEVEAMMKQTLRKLTDANGADGKETIARIDELNNSIVDYDVAELELAKNELERKLRTCERNKIDTTDMLQREMEIKFAISGVKMKLNEELSKKRDDIDKGIYECMKSMQVAESTKATTEKLLEIANRELAELNAKKPTINETYKEIVTRKFDDSQYALKNDDKICPTCGRLLDDEHIQQLKNELTEKRNLAEEKFYADRTTDIEKITEQAEKIKKRETELNEQKTDYEKRISDCVKQIEDEAKEKKHLEKLLAEIPREADYSADSEYVTLVSQLEEVQKNIAQADESNNHNGDSQTDELQSVTAELEEVRHKIAMAANNSTIEDRIEELRRQLKEYSQEKANCEKIKYQIETINRYKNERLEESVNKHFKYTKWRLFKRQKDGKVIDDCTPTVDGYVYDESTNHGREIISQIDICYSLQRFFGMYLPVVADNMESLDEKLIPTQEGTQLIALIRKDCDLTVKNLEAY